MQLLFFPILVLNLLSGLIGGIWLLFHGELIVVFSAIVSSLLSPYLLSFLIMFSLIFSAPLEKLEEYEHRLYFFFLYMLSLSWTFLVMAAWCIMVFNIALLLSHSQSMQMNYYIPYMLLAYSVATHPIKVFAKADTQIGLVESGIYATLFCFTNAIIIFIGHTGITLGRLICIYGVTIFILLILMGYLIWKKLTSQTE